MKTITRYPEDLRPYVPMIEAAQRGELPRRPLTIPYGKRAFLTSDPNTTILNSLASAQAANNPANWEGLRISLASIQRVLNGEPEPQLSIRELLRKQEGRN